MIDSIDWNKFRSPDGELYISAAYTDQFGVSYRAMHYIAMATKLAPINSEIIANIVVATARELQILDDECRHLKPS